ncbi:MAG TPA: hypothetical protein VFC19_40945 [Candidatus Limnocylindrales bacterium]|nr:hypothetical protein [Candidatus Limnocylindrales bacterium]
MWIANGTWCQAGTRTLMAGDTDTDGRDEVVAVNYIGPAGTWRVYRWSGAGLATFAQVAQNSGWSDMAR